MVNQIANAASAGFSKTASMARSIGGSSEAFKNAMDKTVKQDAQPNESNKADERPEKIESNKDKGPTKDKKVNDELDKSKEVDDAIENAEKELAPVTVALQSVKAINDAQQELADARALRPSSNAEQLMDALGLAGDIPVQDALLDAGKAQFVQTAMNDIRNLTRGITKETFEQKAVIDDLQILEGTLPLKTSEPGLVSELSLEYQQQNSKGSQDGAELDFAGLMNNPQQPLAQQALPEGTVVIDASAGREQVMTQLIDSIATAINSKSEELTIQFKPAVLGGLTVKLAMTSSGLVADITTNSHQTNALISSEIAQLQEALKDRGIPVQQVNVTNQSAMNAGDFGQQSFYQGAQQQNTQGGRYYYSKADEDTFSAVGSLYGNMLVDAPAADDDAQDASGVIYTA